MTHATREAWLCAATDALRPSYGAAGFPLPEVRLAVGFPSRWARGGKRLRLGECWPAAAAADGIAQAYVTPLLGDPVEILAVLVHELAHAATPGAGHRGPFKRLARELGLEGKMTATHAGSELAERLGVLADELGPLPHGALSASARKKQSTRMLKLTCPCGMLARASRGAIDEHGAPAYCGEPMALEDGGE